MKHANKPLLTGMANVLAMLMLVLCPEAGAAVTDLSNVPLASSSSTVVRPNILFTLDDSGSMAWNYLPDYAGGTTYAGGSANHCKVSNTCGSGETPFRANAYNGMAYNPSISYQLPVNADGTTKPSQNCANTGGTVTSCAAAPFTGGWTAVKVDGYGVQSTGTINMTTGYPEVVYSTFGSAPYKKNGVDTNNPFSYRATVNGTTSGTVPSPDTNDDPPLYAFPGSLQAGGAVVANVFNGTLNQGALATSTVFNGALDVSTAASTTTLSGVSLSGGSTVTLTGVTVSHSGSTVTVNYTAVSPALATGDTVVVSGASCSNGFVSGGGSLAITVVSTTRFTYTSTTGTTWTGTTCTINATKANQVVTVAYTAISPALATGDTVVVSGTTCGTGYKSGGGSRTITRVDATHFTYTSSAGTTWGTSCTVAATKAAHTAVAPKISKSGGTVTVTLAAAPVPALVNGAAVTVTNGAGACDAGYQATAATLTVTSATTFTYPAATAVGTATNANCNISMTAVIPPVSPGVSNAGTVVTVYKTAHGLVTGDRVQVGSFSIKSDNITVTVTLPTPTAPVSGSQIFVWDDWLGAGTCDNGYRTGFAVITNTGSGTFTYPAPGNVSTASDTGCRIQDLTSGSLLAPLVTPPCDSGYQTNGAVAVTVLDANRFTYTSTGGATTNSSCVISKVSSGTTTAYTTASTVNGNPYYFVILPTEYCDSIYLTNCVAASAPTGLFTNPAPVRFCKDAATAVLPPGAAGAQSASGATINCQAKYSVGTGINFQYARYGLFWRGDIAPTRTAYGNENVPNGTHVSTLGYAAGGTDLDYSGFLAVDRSRRADCAAAPNCTYAEEMTNFSNWYAYYGTRMQMMKSAAGQAFLSLDNRYRVGFVTINESSTKYLPVAQFDATQKTNWYSKFYAINPGSSTPLREALSHAGRYFAGKQPGVLTGDPMEYACQQNFDLITTDGYWNGTDANVKEMDGTTTMRNYDNVNANPSKRSDGAYDGGVTGASNTLADVAMYYYKTDLRDSSMGNCTGALGTDVCDNIVPMTAKDKAAGLLGTQHMKVFSLGLADGLMTYQKDYETAASGDFYKIVTAAINCSFSGSGTCNWPLPVHDSQTALDDLWHAAVNARGTFYQARNPSELADGLLSALAGINVRLAAAAASATSSPVITQHDNSIFSSTYRTTKWDGDVQARLVDPASGNVIPAVMWSAQAQLDAKGAADSTDSISSRHIYTFDPTTAASGLGLKDFMYGGLTAAEQAYFDNKCSFALLTQCSAATLTTGEIATGNSGLNLVHYLRGNKSLETAPVTNDEVFRARDHLLGDTVNAKPAYVKLPQYSFNDTGYSDFKTAQAGRQGVLYMGSNDGMLHAFNSDTGDEMWAYIPKIVMPNLYKLAEKSYATLHQYYVDGSPEVMDIYVNAERAVASGMTVGWHTILVGGLGLGGRGFYALDVTDPANPQGMWETCSDSTLCPTYYGVTHSDPDIGYSYGNPVITKRSTDGKWVVIVTSGYNNVSPGSGQGTLFVLDAVTGQILTIDKASTGAATNPPSGLAKISPWVDDISKDHTTRYIYGGDLNGDVWRFDLGAVGANPLATAPVVTRIASLKDNLGAAQSVTTRPALGDPLRNVASSLSGVGNPAIFIGTGRYLGASDVSNTQIQTIYGLKDDFSLTGAAADFGNPRLLSIFNATGNTALKPITQQYIYQSSSVGGSTSKNTVNWHFDHAGWFADFVITNSATNAAISPSVGERINLDPALVSTSLIVVTNIPQTSACTIGGVSWLYNFNFLSGSGESQLLGNELAVGFDIVLVQGGTPTGGGATVGGGIKLIGSFSGGAPPVTYTPNVQGGATRRASWRELP